MQDINFVDIWNETLVGKERPIVPRDYCYASELGQDPCKRWCSMKGLPMSNPFDARTKRKFWAGNIFEDIIVDIFVNAGIFEKSQEDAKVEFYPAGEKYLRVHGRPDAMTIEVKDWDPLIVKAEENTDIDDSVREMTVRLLKHFKKNFPQGLPKAIFEIKTVHSDTFWRYLDTLKVGYAHHRMQVGSYMKHFGFEKGYIIYLSKDDLAIEQAVVLMKDVEQDIIDDVVTMTALMAEDTMPKVPALIKYDDVKRRYSINWDITNSTYRDFQLNTTLEQGEEAVKYADLAVRRLNAELKKTTIIPRETVENIVYKKSRYPLPLNKDGAEIKIL